MKIIHTSDWHLGQVFYHYERDDEHQHFFVQLAAIMERERPDALVVSGDIFHNPSPSAAAQKLLVENVMSLHDASPDTTIILTAGNHDSGSRIDANRSLWLRSGIHVIGACQRSEDGCFDPAQFVVEIPGKGYVVAAPHFHPSTYPPAAPDMPREDRAKAFYQAILDAVAGKGLPVVLMAHLAVSGCDTTGHDENLIGGMLKDDIDVLGEGYDYLALGHIHKPQSITARAYYSGSPFPMNFSEDYPHFVNIVDIASHGCTPHVRQEFIRPLRKVITIPEEGAPLEAALNALAELDKDKKCYVRLLVDQESPLDADADDRANKAAEGKECRFCEVYIKPKEQSTPTTTQLVEINEVDDFTRISPLEIAKISYAAKKHTDMRESLIQKMQEAIDDTTKISDL